VTQSSLVRRLSHFSKCMAFLVYRVLETSNLAIGNISCLLLVWNLTCITLRSLKDWICFLHESLCMYYSSRERQFYCFRNYVVRLRMNRRRLPVLTRSSSAGAS
jgi:hypothetical protein